MRPRVSSVDSTAKTHEGEFIGLHFKEKKHDRKWQIFNLARRLGAAVSACVYVYASMTATWWALHVLGGARNPTETLRVFMSSLIKDYVGDGLISSSSLVLDVLGNDTTPRDYVLYLESSTNTSTDGCNGLPHFDTAIYSYDFLSQGYEDMVSSIKYNVTTLADLELVIVVVDCSFSQLEAGNPSEVRVYNLVRSRNDISNLYLVTVSLSVQEYEQRDHNKHGPAVLGMLTLIHDMQDQDVTQYYMAALTYPYKRSPDFQMYEVVGITDESYLSLHSIPREPGTEPVKHILTARKRGFYNGDSQRNVRTMYSLLDGVNATNALTRWEWVGEAVTIDSWAWVHCVHFFFSLQVIYSLVVLFLVTYQKIRSGKLWLGDPFASLSTATLVMRGVLVLISWAMNSFWSINEFAMSRAAMITGSSPVLVHKELMHADLFTIYFCLVGFMSAVVRERIDPTFATLLFEMVHQNRQKIIHLSSGVIRVMSTYSEAQYNIGIAKVTPLLAEMSPLRLWSSFQLPEKSPKFLSASFSPMIFLLSSATVFAILRKIYRFFRPDKIHQRSSVSTDTSANERAAQGGTATNFEISTGAMLQTRFGLVSDYNNYVFFKGMKFASADGVYCAGYVIVNEKYLVSSKDLLAIVMIKLLRARFANIYVYEVHGHKVKDTARLVFPATFMWSDLWRLNVTVLL
ncbi:hypothetical protein F441_05571 [Phytophthora nicotianae CJ01A1]|uniref:Transmembrane protein n=2 Tax=Phytophthora nicotianae TaxID=4792 RepID=W2H8H5_PHYNI|nr:hypothetical protein L915_05414 [Phytophthora nicotianae]ETL44297.1 hypothetical protein L916_05368 [Phytophthora nicotianae]ETP20769.1 hypothetical protein F441_05571 [Phytophthora nicotianae CJ01A1]